MTRDQIGKAYLKLREGLLVEYGKRLRSREKAEDMLGNALVRLLEEANPHEESDGYVESRLKFAMEEERKRDWTEKHNLWRSGISFVSLEEPTRKHPGESDHSDEDRTLPIADDRLNPEEELVLGETAHLIREAMEELSPMQAAVIRLVLLEGKTIQEAADTMDISKGTVHVHYHRGKARLARVLRGRV